MKQGKLVTFEGIDGSGKSTQARLIFECLKSKPAPTSLLNEPGGTPLGEQVRNLLLGTVPGGEDMDRLTEFLLFAASRSEICRKVILPLYERGEVVLLDRFCDSSLAYQGYGHGVDLDLIRRVNQSATAGLVPDLTIIFDLSPEIALGRLEGGQDRIEANGLPFFERVRNGFLELARREPDRFEIIDATRDIESISILTIAAVEKILS